MLDDGEIVGIGTHDELLASCPTYAEIVESQIGEGSGRMTIIDARRDRRTTNDRARDDPAPRPGAAGPAGPRRRRAHRAVEGLRRRRSGASGRCSRPSGRGSCSSRSWPSSAPSLNVLGPRVLGHGTDIIIDGVRSGGASTSAELHRVLHRGRRCSTSAPPCSACCIAYIARRRRAAAHVPAARPGRGQAQRAAAQLHRPAAAATCSAGSPTTSTTWPRASSRR